MKEAGKSLYSGVLATDYGQLSKTAPYLLLLVVFIFSVGVKVNVIGVGAPYVTIDDQTMYKAGFHVWFGQAPPQRMYLESWISGLSSISTFVARTFVDGGAIGLNLVADAYRDFYLNPDPYVLNYRVLMLVIDILTAVFVFLLAKQVLVNHKDRVWIAVIAASLYLLSFNTLWAYLVARPDTLTVFFSVIGLYLYYRSNFGAERSTLIYSAIFFGLAAGMKLHAAFFVIFVCLDMWRLFGFAEALKRTFWFGIVALLIFAVASGSVIFDPTLYVKLRLLNARDDASPWLQWGDQFITILRGTGWLIVPLVIATMWLVRRSDAWHSERRLSSVIFIALLWVLLFASIRVLRAYWMLPTLPLFYIIAGYGVFRFLSGYWRLIVLAPVMAIFLTQFLTERRTFSEPEYNALRAWTIANVEPEETIYILGYNALNLPLNTSAIRDHKQVLENGFSAALSNNESFTYRHIRLWEERSQYRLLDMLNFKNDEGFRYFGYNGFLPSVMSSLTPLEEIEYIYLQEHFDLDREPEVSQIINNHYEIVTKLTGPGGGGYGLSYDIYQRKR